MATNLLIDGKAGTMSITSDNKELFDTSRSYLYFKQLSTTSTFTWSKLPAATLTLLTSPSPRGSGGGFF